MNRIDQPAQLRKGGPADAPFEIESGLFTPSGRDCRRALFAPQHYERKYAYPLLVWLHGPGRGGEGQLVRIMPMISLRNYVAVAPRGLGLGGNQDELLSWPQTPPAIGEAAGRVFAAVAAARAKLHVDSSRIFLAGFDAGGTMAFRVAMRYPERFAGVLSVCGPFPQGHQPLLRLNAARHVPIFLAVGRESRVYSPSQACDNLRLFHAAGMDAALRQYPCGHQLSPRMLGDMDRWMMEQIQTSTEYRRQSAGRR